jgi:hypothetical protein
MLNELRIRAFWACALWIDHLYSRPSTDTTVPRLLDEVIDDKNFVFSLASLLYKGKVRRSSGSSAGKPNYLQAYEYFYSITRLEPLDQTYPKLTISRAKEMVMTTVQAALRSHYRNAEVCFAVI